jgi:uncharacterized protein YycO
MLVAAFIVCVALAVRAWRAAPGMRRQLIFGLGVLIIIALHSVVDYPLRSMALACLAGVAAGMLVKNSATVNPTVGFGAPEKVKGLA